VDALANALRWDPSAKIDPLVRRDFQAIPSGDSLAAAAGVARASALDVFPVVNTAGQLVGWVGRGDLAEALGRPG
jgi:CBS domain-containing protein